jgi:hypothetical protein
VDVEIKLQSKANAGMYAYRTSLTTLDKEYLNSYADTRRMQSALLNMGIIENRVLNNPGMLISVL